MGDAAEEPQHFGQSVQNETLKRPLSVSAHSYHRRGLRDASEEEEVGHEEADTQVQVDGGAGPLNGAAELKGQDGEHEAQQ